MKDDPRYLALKRGLTQLTCHELIEIILFPNQMVFDNFNFDYTTKRF